MLSSIIFRAKGVLIKRYWRRNNQHNRTSLGSISNKQAIDFIKRGGIEVGKNTYGVINVNYTCGDSEKLIIGDNCSLGRCNFLLGGGHDYQRITTFPFIDEAATSKGPIVVENDVWIGDAVWILSGVTLKKGCVIGTGSIVTHDVPPYAIVAGNPAKVIKYRFPKEVIEKLLDFDVDIDELTDEKRKLLELHVTTENVDRIIDGLSSKTTGKDR